MKIHKSVHLNNLYRMAQDSDEAINAFVALASPPRKDATLTSPTRTTSSRGFSAAPAMASSRLWTSSSSTSVQRRPRCPRQSASPPPAAPSPTSSSPPTCPPSRGTARQQPASSVVRLVTLRPTLRGEEKTLQATFHQNVPRARAESGDDL